MPGQQDRASLVVWGDIATTETRAILVMLMKAQIRYELVQVPTPTESETITKNDFVFGESTFSNHIIDARSIYVGQRDSFFAFLADLKKENGVSLKPSHLTARVS